MVRSHVTWNLVDDWHQLVQYDFM
ncbi:MAG: hypothetical protein QOE72_1526, partial [Chloroflexota bacterium]|nr:hypothetical protein [Chloroflexota bacterium]